MDSPFVVLVVCHANVCRSPLAATLLSRSLREAGLGEAIAVRSAGTDATPGQARCSAAIDWAEGSDDGGAMLIDSSELGRAGLVLVADRANRAAAALAAPDCRPRMFTLQQAALLAEALTPLIHAGVRAADAPPMPDDLNGRWTWLVGELDASRSLLAGRDEESDDIADGHGPQPHDEVFEQVAACVAPIARLLEACAAH